LLTARDVPAPFCHLAARLSEKVKSVSDKDHPDRSAMTTIG
jgi:hypothetical protein